MSESPPTWVTTLTPDQRIELLEKQNAVYQDVQQRLEKLRLITHAVWLDAHVLAPEISAWHTAGDSAEPQAECLQRASELFIQAIKERKPKLALEPSADGWVLSAATRHLRISLFVENRHKNRRLATTTMAFVRSIDALFHTGTPRSVRVRPDPIPPPAGADGGGGASGPPAEVRVWRPLLGEEN